MQQAYMKAVDNNSSCLSFIRPSEKGWISLGLLLAGGGIFLSLAANRLLPQGVNAISQLGLPGKCLGYGVLGAGVLGILRGAKCRIGDSKHAKPKVVPSDEERPLEIKNEPKVDLKLLAYQEEITKISKGSIYTRLSDYCNLAKKQIQEGYKDEADKTLDLAVQTLKDLDYEFDKQEDLCRIARIRLLIKPNVIPKELTEAHHLLDKKLEDRAQESWIPGFYLALDVPQVCLLIECYSLAGDSHQVKELLEKAKNIASSHSLGEYINALNRIVETLKSLGSETLVSYGLHEEENILQSLIESYENVKKKVEEAKKGLRFSKNLCKIANELVGEGKKEVADLVLREVGDELEDKLEFEDFCRIAKVRLKITPGKLPDELNKAKDLLRSKMWRESNRSVQATYVVDYCALAELYTKAQEKETALTLLEDATTLANSATARTAEYLSNLAKIASAYIAMEETKLAKQILYQRESNISSLSETNPEIFSLLIQARLVHRIDSADAKSYVSQAECTFQFAYKMSLSDYERINELDRKLEVLSNTLNLDTFKCKQASNVVGNREASSEKIETLIKSIEEALETDPSSARSLCEQAWELFKVYAKGYLKWKYNMSTVAHELKRAKEELMDSSQSESIPS